MAANKNSTLVEVERHDFAPLMVCGQVQADIREETNQLGLVARK
jgi:hypothetical protein